MSRVADEFPPDVPDDSEVVSCRRVDHLAWLTIERPEVMNALSFPTLKRFRTLLEELREDMTLRCILITGAGDQAFCSGADLKERYSMPDEVVPHFVRNIRSLMDDVERMPQPTVAVINGFAFGGGMELALACDLRVAAEDAVLGLTETSLAIIPGAGGTQRLPKLVGKSRAKDLILTARRLDAMEGETMGLVNRTAAAADLGAVALEVAEQVSKNGPVAVRAAKEAIDRGSELSIEEGLAIEAECYARTLTTSDRKEALTAFSEKRKPAYRGE